MKHKRSTDAIVALAKMKSEETAQQVEQAIKQLIKKMSVLTSTPFRWNQGFLSLTYITIPIFEVELKCFVNNGNSHLEL